MPFQVQVPPPLGPRPVVRAPWDTHDNVELQPFAAWFVGEELWAQTHGCVWRLGPDRPPRLLRVTAELRLTRAAGRWVELRTKHGWTRPFGPIERDVFGIHLYDTDTDAWYDGPWPDGLDLWLRHAIEPEDFVLHEALRGWSLDVSRADRHDDPVFSADGAHALIDDQIVDLRNGEVKRDLAARSTTVEELCPAPLPVLGPPGIRAAWRPPVEALTVAAGCVWRAFYAGDSSGPFAVVAQNRRPIALLSSGVRAVAFDAPGRQVALVAERSVEVYALDDLAAPRWQFELPWPWCDPFQAVQGHGGNDETVERRRLYRDQFGPWLDADIEQRAHAAAEPPRAPPVEEPGAFEDDIPF